MNREERRKLTHDLLGLNACFNCECLEEYHKEICEGTLHDLANKS